MADIAEYVDGLSLLAKQMNEQVRALIVHSGEKGRAAEQIVRDVARTILPKKISIGSGFIVSSLRSRSPQLDVVLFDEHLNAPISLVGNIGVFPVECVYGVIEVKTSLTSAELNRAAKAIHQVRQFKSEKFYVAPAMDFGVPGLLPSKQMQVMLAPRNYIFAFDTSYRSPEALERAISAASSAHNAFFHGVIVLSKDWFVWQVARKRGQPKKFKTKTERALAEFALKLSRDTIRYPMYPADMTRYLGPPDEE